MFRPVFAVVLLCNGREMSVSRGFAHLRRQFQGKSFRTDKYSVLDAACVQMQFLYNLLVEVGPSLGWENPVAGDLSCS